MILACYKKKLKVSASEIKAISPILHYVTGNREKTAGTHYPENPNEHHKPIYYEVLDSTVNVIKDKFAQPTFKLFTQAEQLFLKVAGKQDVTDELKVLETHFKGDYDADSLISQLQQLPTISECEPINLEEVVKVLKSLSQEKRMLIGNCVTAIKTILTTGATSATPVRSFSMLRRIETWLQSRMT